MSDLEDSESCNNNIIDYLDYYFFGNNNTDYAVLITGSWGSGKTYFIKNKIFEKRKETAKPLYITLNGVTSISDITDQFFSQLHPWLSSKSVKMMGVLVSRTLNGYVGTDVAKDADDKSILKDALLNVNNRVIIFDDLERCLIPIQSTLGYINSLVEHDGCKVLIVASENDISEEQKEEYYVKKEKVIGKTISLVPPIIEVIDHLCDNLKSNLAKEILLKHKKSVIGVVHNSDSINFRSVRAILDDFDRVLLTFESYFKSSPRAIIKLLTSMLAIGVEYRAGKISSHNVENIPTNSLIYSIANSNSNTLNIIEKYPSVEWFDPVIPYTSLAELFSTGVIDVDNIRVYLSQHPLLSSNNFNKYWRDLWSWTDLTRTNYIKALQGLKGQLGKFEIVDPEIIMHVVGILLSLENKNDKYATSGVDVVKYFINYIDEVKFRKLLLPNVSFFSANYSLKHNLGFISNSDEKFLELKEYLKHAVSYRFQYSIKKTYPDLLLSMSGDPAEYLRLYEYGIEEGNYGGFPFLHLIPPGHFTHMIIDDWVCNGRLLASLNERYARDKHNKDLDCEYLWVRKLMKMTRKIANNAHEPQRSQLIARLDYYFNTIDANFSFSKTI